MSDEDARKLATLIFRTAKKFQIPANIYAAILMQESGYYQYATSSKKCGFVLKPEAKFHEAACIQTDIGISQINYDTIQKYGFDPERLYNDLNYAVEAGAQVLAWFYKTYHHEPMWYVRYNCGTKPDINRLTCQEYKRRVSRWL